ncbi:MAG TPA: NAD-dependent epimerase/dehydratase family protein [Anaeromyxobacteraceae bacterium]|nr:NAD-dependent epimerase/dehydratase family protein [Anaeromyxobacteraceae bacterium]
MRVFITGGTGYIGSAIVEALLAAGHKVSGVSRSHESDAVLRRLEVEPVRGALGELAKLVPFMAQHDVLVHAAIDYGLGPAADREAIDAMLEAARQDGGPKAVVYTSGVWVLGNTPTPADEGAPVDHPAAASAWRPEHERIVLDAATEHLATAVIRPGMVFGERRGLLSPFFQTAVKEGAAAFVGDGTNHWALVHREDLAELYRLTVEKRARGVFHGVDGASPTVAELARAASVAAGKGAIRAIPLEEARAKMGVVADALVLDQFVVAPRALELGWQPKVPPFVQSVARAFREWSGG